MHIPVLLNEVIHYLAPKDNAVYIDATFGGGGYSRAILNAANCRVIGFDRDPDAVLRAHEFAKEFPGRFEIIHAPFSHMNDYITDPVDGVVFDYGVSSFQLDEADRGFSFRQDGPLDMRMSKEGQSVEEVVNTFSERDLADIIYHYGDETQSRSIARAIVKARSEYRLTTTLQLAEIIRRIVRRKDGIDPATKSFQALRIYVNNELIEIDETLNKTLPILRDGAKLVAVTFHSLEDRIVKNFMRKSAQGEAGGRLHIETRQPVTPTDAELQMNPRARSAKLRAATMEWSKSAI